MRQKQTIKGTFTKEQLNSILGEPNWMWVISEDNNPKCGLHPGKLPTAGWGDIRAYGRIWIHSDGICFGSGMGIQENIDYTNKMYRTVKEATNGNQTIR